MDLAPFLARPFAVQSHLAAALLSLALGTVMLIRRKGTGSHKALDRVWVGLTLAVARAA